MILGNINLTYRSRFTPLSVILNYARRDILEARRIDEKFRENVGKVLRDNNLSTDLVDFNLQNWDEYDAKLERVRSFPLRQYPPRVTGCLA